MFVKTNARNPNGKKMSISRIIWQEIQKHLAKIEQARADGKELKLELQGAKHLILNRFDLNGLWYVGVHDLTPAGTIIPMSGMNFNEEEWKKLREIVSEINNIMKSNMSDTTKRNAEGESVVNDVLMYRWSWCVGKKKISESDVSFFSEDDCRNDGSAHLPNKDKAAMVIETVWVPPPPKFLHMHQVFLFLIKKYIEQLVKSKCQGCSVDSGSQKDHMGELGCLNEGKDYLSDFFNDARMMVTLPDLIALFITSRHEMGANSTYADLYAEATMFYMSLEGSDLHVKQDQTGNRNLIYLFQRC